MLNPVINEIVALFAEVNVIEDPIRGSAYGLPRRVQSWRRTYPRTRSTSWTGGLRSH